METVKLKPEWTQNAHLNAQQFAELQSQALNDPEGFWAEKAQRLHWSKTWDRVKNVSYTPPVKIEWFGGGELNACYNCVDRHLEHSAQRVAFYWEPDDPGSEGLSFTYQQVFEQVQLWGNMLKSHGVKKGDRVTIYLPMIPQAVFSMLACARVGAIHSVVFGGFSPEALAQRILDCESEFLITADEGLRGQKLVPLKKNADAAAAKAEVLKKVFVVRHTGGAVQWQDSRDVWVHEELTKVSPTCPPEPMKSEDPLFILYTSGSTGKPKGVLHTTGGYLCYASYTHEIVFDYHQEDVYWCAADVGWITGHSYIVYGPMSNAVTQVLYEGVPNYPKADRIWQIVDKYKVNTLYTAPTAIRALMAHGSPFLESTNRDSLRLLGSVGEPINEEAWHWYFEKVGKNNCPIVDTWWQTETGGILITPLPGVNDLKPGRAMQGFLGIHPVIVDESGQELEGEAQGFLCFKDSWPGQMVGVYKNQKRFEDTYFSQCAGYYFAGDGVERDKDGHLRITGRVDDVLNCSGHRMGTAEIENALDHHAGVAEAAVVGFPHEIKGQGIYAFVTLVKGTSPTPDLKTQLLETVKKEIGAIAKPDFIQWAPQLPKTRSGKIMRRILRKIAADELEDLGDISTLADPSVVESLVNDRMNRT